jgi:hypothetical protein
MLKFTLACLLAGACGGLAYAANPAADNTSGLVLHSTLASLDGEHTGISAPAAVKPGETLTITGACVTRVKSADDLRVVLTLAHSGVAKPGYHVLPTEQRIANGGLNVRVPDLPETQNHVFLVKVFRLRDDEPEVCNAGAIRVGSAERHKLG